MRFLGDRIMVKNRKVQKVDSNRLSNGKFGVMVSQINRDPMEERKKRP